MFVDQKAYYVYLYKNLVQLIYQSYCKVGSQIVWYIAKQMWNSLWKLQKATDTVSSRTHFPNKTKENIGRVLSLQ